MKFSFKNIIVLLGAYLLSINSLNAQVSYEPGPPLKNDPDNKMNRMLGGDENSFYCYRVRSRGKGTSFFVEKYNKATLKPEFSKEINLGENESETKIEDVEYASGSVFVFRRQYNKKNDKMTLFFQTVSSSGQVSKDLKEIITIKADHYEFVDFDIFPNPSRTKFIVKASHKADKNDQYRTELVLIDAVNIKKLSERTVPENLHSGGSLTFSFFGGFGEDPYGFVGLHLDDKDNIYYCMTEKTDKKDKKYKLYLYTLLAGESKSKKISLSFDEDYYVSDIEFSKANDNSIVVGGFLKDVVERKGRDLVKCGIFSFKVDAQKGSVKAKTSYFFDGKMLMALESSPKRSRYFKYKLDYIIPVGDAVYYVGEQYNEVMVTSTTNNNIGSSSRYWNYEYMDVIVAKLNANGEFEWIRNVPLRNEMKLNYPHVFKQYIAYATSTNLYILCNDHPKNMERYEKAKYEPSDLKSTRGIHGSNFVSNAVDLKTGKIKRQVVFENDDYCFAPIQERNPQFIPPSDSEIFVPGKENEIYIFTEDRGKDKFGRIKFE